MKDKAFPRPYSGNSDFAQEGMDLRDYFASKAMQAVLTGSAWTITKPDVVAEKAYEYADAMMKARKL